MALISLVYVSYASETITDDELKSLLKKCRSHNEKIDVTGMLLHRNGFFIQALEGDEQVVIPLYDKIKKDPRHVNVVTVSKEVIDEPLFPNWSMGFNHVSNENLNDLNGFSDYLSNDFDSQFFTRYPSKAHQLLKSFCITTQIGS